MHKTTYSLNPSQTHTLLLIYKFRFITASLLCQYKNLSSPSVTNNSLQILHQQKYLLKQYDSSYRLLGKGAVYSLDKLAMKFLIDDQKIDKALLHPFYKNASASDKLVDHNLNILRVYLALRDAYPTQFDIFTKQELKSSQRLPDLYLKPKAGQKENQPTYLLELHNDTDLYITRKRIRTLIKYYEEDWDSPNMPVLLFVAKNASDERRINEYALDRLESAGMEDELLIYTSNINALLVNSDIAVWTNVIEPDNTINLINECS